MAAVSSISNAAQYGFEQLKLQQARRSADQAELTAQALQQQAGQAQRDAQRANENARTLSVQASQAQDQAGQARQGLAAMKTAKQSFVRLSSTVDQVQARQTATEATTAAVTSSNTATAITSTATNIPPVVNSQGQVTGKIINTTA